MSIRKGIKVEKGQVWTIGEVTIKGMNKIGSRLYKEKWIPISNEVTILEIKGTQIHVENSNGIKTEVKMQNLGNFLRDS